MISSSNIQVKGWESATKNSPPGFRTSATVRAQGPRSGSQEMAPCEVKTTSNCSFATCASDGGGVGHIGVDEAGLDRQLPREAPGVSDRSLREVDPGHPGAAARPRQGVEPEVALQVEERLPAHVTHPFEFDGIQRLAPGLETLHVVELAGDVELGPRVPEIAVGADRVGGAAGRTGARGDGRADARVARMVAGEPARTVRGRAHRAWFGVLIFALHGGHPSTRLQ